MLISVRTVGEGSTYVKPLTLKLTHNNTACPNKRPAVFEVFLLIEDSSEIK